MGSTAAARVIVCGSRKWHDRKLIAETLNRVVLEHGWRYPEPTIVHGGARGADRLAEDEAGKAGLLTEAHPADWDRYGKRAGLIRNEEMAALGADLCIGFWDGESTGTAHMLGVAHRHGIPVEVVRRTPTAEPSPKSAPSLSEPREERVRLMRDAPC